MAIAVVRGTQTFIDHSREMSSTKFYVAGDAADDLTAAMAALNAVGVALGVVTLCTPSKTLASFPITENEPDIPASQYAQREVALWIQYVDTTTTEYETMQVPGPNLLLLAQANTDEVDIVSNLTMAALVLVLESDLVSKAGNEIAVTRARIIGRRS